MHNISLKELANKMNILVIDLIKYFSNIGIIKNSKSYISSEEKKKLLIYLNRKNIKFTHTIILQRKVKNNLSIHTTNKKIQIEFKRIKSFYKPNINNIIEHNKIDDINDNKTLPNEKNKIHFNKNFINKKFELQNNHGIIQNLKNPIDIDNKKIVLAKTKINKNILYSKKKNKAPLNKINLLNTKISKKLSNSNKFSQYKKSYKPLSQPVNHKNNLSIENKNYNKDKKIKNLHRINKIKNFDNKIEKKILKLDINKYNISNVKNSCLQQIFKKPIQFINKNIILRDSIIVSELANKMAIKSSELIKKMISLGIVATINETLDCSTAELIASEMGHKVIIKKENTLETLMMKDRNSNNDLIKIRPPVVTIMGHVDHGKTSLLDCIRSTKIALKESGGITQHIGAYHVNIRNNIITFLDTPGHAAFTAMRLRGAQITDIIVLVIAADDGVKPQTIEAIQHSKAANVPVIVAINKIDKLEKNNLDEIKTDLSKYNILSEEWGGQNIFIEVSAKKKIGIKKLLDNILLQSEMLELKTKVTGMAKGVVIESYLDKGRGPIATILVKEGLLSTGDVVISGCMYGKIRCLKDEHGKTLLTVGPSIPVEILGLSGVPIAGDEITVVKNEKQARGVASYRQCITREKTLLSKKRLKLENLFENMHNNNIIQLKLILKVDVQGSLEAISESLYKMSNKEIEINIINSGVGGITETDASLAAATNSIILGFNVRADSSAKKIIESEVLDLRYYSVIYDLLNEVKQAVKGLLIPEHKQEIIGLAEVRNIFKSPKFNVIAGCMIVEGIIKRNNPIRILRNNIVIYEGQLESLRRFKEDINELRNGMECGIGVKNYNDIRVGDKIEVFKLVI